MLPDFILILVLAQMEYVCMPTECIQWKRGKKISLKIIPESHRSVKFYELVFFGLFNI